MTNIKLPTKTEWYRCPECAKKLVLYDDTAKCNGVFVYCRRCKKDIEIIIK